MTDDYSNVGNVRKSLRALLDKDPLLTPKHLAELLNLPYKQYRNYLTKERCEWKYYHQNERGLNRSCPDDVHRSFFVGCLRLPFVVGDLPVGWVRSRARNKFLLFRDYLGRIRWFESGTVELYVRKPAGRGKAVQLFCNGFTKTGLLVDMKVLDEFVKGLRIRGFHAVFDTDQRLPYMKVDVFKESNKFTLILGDRTHPHSAELIVEYLDQAEQATVAFEDLVRSFQVPLNGVPEDGKQTRIQEYLV